MPREAPDADRRLVQAIADPGSILPRLTNLGPEGDEYESIPSWGARALVAAGLAVRTKPALASPREPREPREQRISEYGVQSALPCASTYEISAEGLLLRFRCSRLGSHVGEHESVDTANVLLAHW